MHIQADTYKEALFIELKTLVLVKVDDIQGLEIPYPHQHTLKTLFALNGRRNFWNEVKLKLNEMCV